MSRYEVVAIDRTATIPGHRTAALGRYWSGWWAIVRAKQMNAMPIGAEFDHVVVRRYASAAVVVWRESEEAATRRRLWVEARRLAR